MSSPIRRTFGRRLKYLTLTKHLSVDQIKCRQETEIEREASRASIGADFSFLLRAHLSLSCSSSSSSLLSSPSLCLLPRPRDHINRDGRAHSAFNSRYDPPSDLRKKPCTTVLHRIKRLLPVVITEYVTTCRETVLSSDSWSIYGVGQGEN